MKIRKDDNSAYILNTLQKNQVVKNPGPYYGPEGPIYQAGMQAQNDLNGKNPGIGGAPVSQGQINGDVKALARAITEGLDDSPYFKKHTDHAKRVVLGLQYANDMLGTHIK